MFYNLPPYLKKFLVKNLSVIFRFLFSFPWHDLKIEKVINIFIRLRQSWGMKDEVLIPWKLIEKIEIHHGIFDLFGDGSMWEYKVQWFLVIDRKASRSCVIISAHTKIVFSSKWFVIIFYETEKGIFRPPALVSPKDFCFATFSNLFALRLQNEEYLLLFS